MLVNAYIKINKTQAATLRKTIIRLLMGFNGLSKSDTLDKLNNGRIYDNWNNDINAPIYNYSIMDMGKDKVWMICGSTCGGHYHWIGIYNDMIRVVHEGARTSVPGNAMDLIYEYKDAGVFDSADWTIEKYETSQPDWAPVAGFLFGKFGQDDKPANAFEADLFKAQEIMMLAKKLGLLRLKLIERLWLRKDLNN